MQVYILHAPLAIILYAVTKLTGIQAKYVCIQNPVKYIFICIFNCNNFNIILPLHKKLDILCK